MQDAEQTLFGLQVDHQSVSHLREGARWARFIALSYLVIMTLVIITLLLVLAFQGDLIRETMTSVNILVPSWIIPAAVLLVSLFCFISLYYYYQLLSFSRNSLSGIDLNEQQLLNNASRSLKIYMMFTAFFAILGLLFSIVLAVVSVYVKQIYF